jgi:photosystem II stability/assembly factor-like uncharacterized protein
MKRIHRCHAVFALVAAALVFADPAAGQRGGRGGGGGRGPQQAREVGSPRFDYLGPSSAGRISAAAAVAGQPGVYYAGAASGGVWKSADGGVSWKPTFDDQKSQAIGALAVAQSDPNVVWAGTGEGWAVRDMDVIGDGIYKSTDAGETWTHMGLETTGRIGTIAIHPTNAEIVFACALGTAHAPQRERGVFRTTNGGQTWEQVLFVNEQTGCSGVQISQQDPNIVLVGTWEVEMYTWVLHGGGPGSGVYISRNGGRSFSRINHPGLPESPVGKIDVAIAPSDGNRMYALIQTGSDGVKGLASKAQGSLWRSDDAGRTWRVVSWDRRLIGRAGYYIRIRVSPDDPDHMLVANSTLWRSRDGGVSFSSGGGGCGDCHDGWWDPNANMAGHYIVTGDGGLGIFGSPNNPTGNTSVSLPIGQMYHIAIDDQNPYWVYSDRQDNGSMRISSAVGDVPERVPSYAPPAAAVAPEPEPQGRGGRGGRGGGGRGGRGGRGGGPPAYQQQGMPACESGHVMPVPGNPNIVWGSCYGNHIAVMDVARGTRRSVSPWQHTLDHEPVGLKYRCHWAPPVAMDYHDVGTVYYGCQVVFRTRNQGQSWDVISPDLSTGEKIAFSGGVTGDNLGQFYGSVVFAITTSQIQRDLLWAGTNDGKLWVTRDGGANWSDVGSNIPNLRPWATIRKIDASTFDAGTAYASFDYHLEGHHDPYIYKTTDFGRTWTTVSDGLPHGHALDYVMSVTENPHRRGMLFAGTGRGFYYSLDDGGTWTQFKDRLPAAPVTGIAVPRSVAEVAVSTYGRGIWILRDLWQLEQGDISGQQGELLLYKPRPGVRGTNGGTANFVFALRSAPAQPISMEILDASGAVINTSQVQGRVGMNEVSWNLLYPAPNRPTLRALPPDNPFIWEGGRFSDGERPVTHWGLGGANWTPRAAPGDYSVRLTHNGRQHTQPFTIVRDPNVPGTDAELKASLDLQQNIITAMNEVVDRINRLEIMRKQVEELRAQNANNRTLDQALEQIGQRMYETELHFLSRTEMHSDDKWYVEKYKLYLNLVWLLAEVGGGGGDVAGGVAYGPTDSSTQVFAEHTQALQVARTDFDRLMQEVAAFNRTHAGRLPAITDQLASTGAGN